MNTQDIISDLSDVGSALCFKAIDHIEALQERIAELERIEFVAVPLGQSRVFADQEKRINELEAQLAAQAGQKSAMRVSLPERVVDCLWQQAGISTYHPDGDQLEKLQEFAVLVEEEVIARLPPPSDNAPNGSGWRYAEMPLEIRLSVVNGASTPQWNAISNKSRRIVISQKTPQEALRLALIGARYAGAETDREGVVCAMAIAAYESTGGKTPYTHLQPQEWRYWERVVQAVLSVNEPQTLDAATKGWQ